MILLDTNVVSATMSRRCPRSVFEWLDRQETESLFLSSITVAEIGYGIRALAAGKRQRDLERRFAKFVAAAFEQRILDFDVPAAWSYGVVMKARRDLGRPLGALDGQIAAIARTHGMAIATRNVKDFEDCGVEVVDPFAS